MPDWKDPWLVAVWPGMGKVALGAGHFLVDRLRAETIGELDAKDFFDVDKIEFRHGVVRSMKLPRNLFYGYRNPQDRDLIIFIGEAQPNSRGLDLCHRLLDEAEKFGVKRVVTFAAMATMEPPSDSPRVFAVANSARLLDEFREPGVEILEEGQISGLNGVLLAAAAERNIEGVCLLGELPYVGIVVPNPRASQALLRLFASHAGLELDFTDLEQKAEAVDRSLFDLMSQIKRSAAQESSETPGSESADSGEDSDSSIAAVADEESRLTATDKAHIEKLFLNAIRDRNEAAELKRELDRLGVFKDYEDRFLDIFKSSH